MLIDGDRAAVFGQADGEPRRIGRMISYRIAQFVRFENDKVVEYMSLIDSFDAVEQVLGQQIAAPGEHPRRRRRTGRRLERQLAT